MNRFVIADPKKCIACRTCEVACALAHPIGEATAVTLSHENFKPRLHVIKTANISAPVQCRQCENAPCVNSCPTSALKYVEGTVQLDEECCIGCQTCVIACPFGAMEMIDVPVKQTDLGSLSSHKTVSISHKCDLCLKRKNGVGPACIEVCPTHALYLVDQTKRDSSTDQKREKTLLAMTNIYE